MDFRIGTILFLCFIAFVVFISLISYIYEKRRTTALRIVAKSLGLSFSKTGRNTKSLQHEDFQLLSKGYRGEVENEMWGNQSGVNISVFDYKYTTISSSSGSSGSTRHTLTVVSIECDLMSFPSFKLRTEYRSDRINKMLANKISQFVGFEDDVVDINFNSFPEFSRKYFLEGNYEFEIRQLFSPKVINFFESNKYLCNKNIIIEAQKNTLIFYSRRKRYKPNKIKSFLQEGLKVQKVFLGTASVLQSANKAVQKSNKNVMMKQPVMPTQRQRPDVTGASVVGKWRVVKQIPSQRELMKYSMIRSSRSKYQNLSEKTMESVVVIGSEETFVVITKDEISFNTKGMKLGTNNYTLNGNQLDLVAKKNNFMMSVILKGMAPFLPSYFRYTFEETQLVLTTNEIKGYDNQEVTYFLSRC